MRIPEFPAVPGTGRPPEWTGDGFLVDGTLRRVLAYGAGASGWNDALTTLHEHAAGSDHFIDVASRRHALEEARRAHSDTDHVVLEIGSSSGYLLQELVRALPRAFVIGADYTYGTLEQLATRLSHVPLLQFDLVNCPLPDASVDTVILLNVLEHIERDDLAVNQLHRILRPGGVAIIEVPAGPGVYDDYDRALMHFRRYTMSGLTTLMKNAGFTIVRKSHLAFTIYPAFWATKKMGQASPRETQHLETAVESSISLSSKFKGAAGAVLGFEAWLRRVVYLPFGIRCLVTCRKRA